VKKILILFVVIFLVAGCGLKKETKKKVNYKNIDSDQLSQMLKSKDLFLLDVHIPEQRHIKGTDEFIPYNEIDGYEDKLPRDKEAKIVVYCHSGIMSEIAAKTLLGLGYTNIYNLEKGIIEWNEKGYELEDE
jgi:rhodanese-related sulfurtransferase